MKAFKILLLVSILATGITSCQQYGKEYKLDKKHNVYYKGDGVDEALVKKLANYLKEQEYFQDSIESTVQLIKVKDTFTLNFVVDASKITSGYDNKFLLFGAYISENVFNKAPVTIQLTNNKLEPFKNLGYAKPISDYDK
ncbi:MAG: hypothetical protein IPP96_03405 [Chitinophagaceae bacterium]|nr:hypothetical protein [Chitinophagaceae bacterium]